MVLVEISTTNKATWSKLPMPSHTSSTRSIARNAHEGSAIIFLTYICYFESKMLKNIFINSIISKNVNKRSVMGGRLIKLKIQVKLEEEDGMHVNAMAADYHSSFPRFY